MSLARTLMSCAVLLGLAEAGLRVTRGCWRPFEDFEDVPRLTDPHPGLGWVNRPGAHGLPGGTIDAFGDRHSGNDVVLFGGSFVYGYGLPDGQIVHDHLQRTGYSVRNRAVPGYGTVQSAALAATTEVRGTTVVYGFVELHEARNVAAGSWLHALERAGRDQPWVAVPWARWDGERLLRGGPIAYEHWSWSERSALVDATERGWVHLGDRLLRTKAETTVRVIEEFRTDVEARGGRFVVALLDVPTRNAFYVRRLEAANIATVDLQVSAPHLPDGHPSASHHHAWAERLAGVL
jgi:hypothetical protein